MAQHALNTLTVQTREVEDCSNKLLSLIKTKHRLIRLLMKLLHFRQIHPRHRQTNKQRKLCSFFGVNSKLSDVVFPSFHLTYFNWPLAEYANTQNNAEQETNFQQTTCKKFILTDIHIFSPTRGWWCLIHCFIRITVSCYFTNRWRLSNCHRRHRKSVDWCHYCSSWRWRQRCTHYLCKQQVALK